MKTIRRFATRLLFLALYRLVFSRRAPDQIIGKPNRPYLLRWYLFGANRSTGKPRRPFGYTFYLHCFVQDDDDRAKHDHPWDWWSLILHNGYIEHRDVSMEDCDAGVIPDRGASEVVVSFRGRRYYDDPAQVMRHYDAGDNNRGKAEDAHRISLHHAANNEWVFGPLGKALRPSVVNDIFSRCEPRRPCLTLFVMGHWKRDWGFHVPHRGWVPWRQFIAENGQEEA